MPTTTGTPVLTHTPTPSNTPTVTDIPTDTPTTTGTPVPTHTPTPSNTPTVSTTPTTRPTPTYTGRLYLPQVLARWSADFRASRARPVQIAPYLPVLLRSGVRPGDSASP
jgi:hypothetical protein